MSKSTLYNYAPTSPAQITDEYYKNVGSDSFILGNVKRGFLASGFTIEDGSSDGTLLTLDTDYELLEEDFYYQEEAGLTVYTKVKILNPAYYTGALFITYQCVGSYTDATTINTLLASFATVIPVGGVIPYAGERAETPALEDNFVACDGSTISDSDSVYDGQRAYNLNGGDVVLSLSWTADAGGAYATVSTDDIYAINEGDDVTGSGIAADTLVTDITGTTVTISDVSATGSISTTFTNDGLATVGGASGSQADQMQQITGELDNIEGGTAGFMRTSGSVSGAFSEGDAKGDSPAANTANGYSVDFDSADSPNARTGTRTKPHARIMKYAMRVK